MQKAIAAVERALGADGRVLVRYSGTEKKARVMIEGQDEREIRAHAETIADVLKRALARPEPGSPNAPSCVTCGRARCRNGAWRWCSRRRRCGRSTGPPSSGSACPGWC